MERSPLERERDELYAPIDEKLFGVHPIAEAQAKSRE